MPNCDFLAVGADIDCVLNHVLASGAFRLYENYSAFGRELVEFRSVSEVRHQFPRLGRVEKSTPSAVLMLLLTGSGRMLAERIDLDPEKCDGATSRYRASGWGLIQLQFGGLGPGGVVASRTNHNTLKRALKWEGQFRELGSPLHWDWPRIEAASRRLNRFIARTAVRRCGDRPVLPEAAQHQLRADAQPTGSTRRCEPPA